MFQFASTSYSGRFRLFDLHQFVTHYKVHPILVNFTAATDPGFRRQRHPRKDSARPTLRDTAGGHDVFCRLHHALHPRSPAGCFG